MKKLTAFFSISALAGAALLLAAAPGNTASYTSDEPEVNMAAAERACQIALDTGSAKALQQYRRLYPSADTACNATASTGRMWTRPEERKFLTVD